ncbi:endospore germination permease [Clostridium sp. JS66]|uniref:GerAB/ArcD/ProY family transporter n=1 Tax=Clostridium sp. JS66 TaxID=3064705 RepID=UPI00298EA907|nr:endospore germination permease [Clostridium sp. JS66]WPC44372.1 endospore germination permease [Clostridium sp. JS66]
MKIEKGVISSTQLIFLIIGLLETSTLTVAFIGGLTKQNTWIVLLAGFIIISFLLLVYVFLSKKYPEKNLIEMNTEIYGTYFGKVVSILYICYFWFIIPANLRFISDFFSTYLFSETNISVFVISIMVICIYTVRKGLEVIARVGFILSLVPIVVALFITISTIKDIHITNFLPLFQINLKEFIQGTNIMVSIPFGEIVVFLMIFPYVNDKKQIKKSAFTGFIIGSVYFLFIILRNTAVLGNIGFIHVLTSYQVAKIIDVGEVITRVEILIALSLLFNMFLKICIFYYVTVLSIAQFFELQSYRSIAIPVGIISIVLSITMYNSSVEEAYQAGIYSVYAIIFIILIPIISLILASMRKSN